MRVASLAALTIAALAGFSLAQEMPKCAADCLIQGLEVSECEATDFECICADAALMSSVQACSMGACTVIEGLAATNATATLCNQPVRDKSTVAPIATAISGSLATAFVALRLYEAYVRKEWQWADLCALLSLLSSLVLDVFEFFMKSAGFGKDIWTLEPKTINDVIMYTWITQLSYIPAIVLTKVAILLFFIRVFPSPGFRKVCIGTIIYGFLFMISTMIALILSCIPLQATWSIWTGESGGVCFNNTAFFWAHSAINISLDLWIIALPIPKLWNLQMGMKKRIYLILMFSVGIFITIISIIRLSGMVDYSDTTNPTYANVMVATYSVIECNISIVCCCMPALYSFLRRVFPTVFGGSSAGRSNYKQGSYKLSKVMPSNEIRKTVEHNVSYIPRSDDSDVAELMDLQENKPKNNYNQW